MNCTLSIINLHSQTSHQLFSWTRVGLSKCPIDKIIGSQGHLTVSRVPWVPSVLAKNSITEVFFQINKFWNYALKKVPYPLSKISLHYVMVLDQRLAAFHQLFSWTSVGPLKCPINKTNNSQGHLTLSNVPWLQSVLTKNYIINFLFKWTKFEKRY